MVLLTSSANMALLLMLLCSLFVQNLRSSDLYWVSTSYNICGSLDIAYGFNCSAFVHSPQMPKELTEDLNLAWLLPRDILQLQNLLILNDYFAFDGRHYWDSHFKNSTDSSYTDGKQRWLIFLLLLLSGNVQPNPGPELQCIPLPSDVKSMSGLSVIHLNVRSLLPKMDLLRIWVNLTDADIVVLSETWLTKSITDMDIGMGGYNVFRADRPRKGGGVAIYVKSKFNVKLVDSESIGKQLEFLAVKVELAKGLYVTVVGCYRPPSALSTALQTLIQLLSRLDYSEIILAGDLNWDWLKPCSDEFKSFCDSVNFTQLINSPTRLNLKCHEKSTLIDLILTNVPHKFSAVGVFCNDLSDHCVVAAVRNTKMPKCKPRVICKRNFKKFNEQGFCHDLFNCDWSRIELIPDVESAWIFFRDSFLQVINRHAPLKRFRVKGRDNPWFSSELGDILHDRNLAWAKARKTGSSSDWLVFRQLRNKCSSFIKKAKSDFYLSATTNTLNDPRKFWKAIKLLSLNKDSINVPSFIMKESVVVHDKLEILNHFNEYFIQSGSLFDTACPYTVTPCRDVPVSTSVFNLTPFLVADVQKALKGLAPEKPPGPDLIEPYFLKIAADCVAQPLTYLFNLTLESNTIPKIWKSAFVCPLLKGGDPSNLNNYRPISNLSVLAKTLESLVSDQMKDFLHVQDILSPVQSGFRKKT